MPVCEAHMVSGEPGVKVHSSVSSCWIWDIMMYECVAQWFPITSWPDSSSVFFPNGQVGFSFEGNCHGYLT